MYVDGSLAAMFLREAAWGEMGSGVARNARLLIEEPCPLILKVNFFYQNKDIEHRSLTSTY